jgi:NAD(P)-dependent dehydrogenase (short-subunit alcohol dehydrogenase family)
MKTVLITGTNKGIGLETELTFGRARYKVFATMRNPAKANDFKQMIHSESLDIHISELDVSKLKKSCRNVFSISKESNTTNFSGRQGFRSCRKQKLEIKTFFLAQI